MQRISKKLDVVVFGATGFTGNFVVEEMAKFVNRSNKTISWGIAGRNEQKLKESLQQAETETGLNFSNVSILMADSSKKNTLEEMAKQAKVVINCVGPYQQFGEPVVKSCIANNTDHVDISGEPQFLEGMRLKYDSDARNSGVHIVGACGYDSVPADIGLCYLMKKFPGTLNSAKCYVKTSGSAAPSIHTGTMESAALAIANRNLVTNIRRELYPTRLPKPAFKQESCGPMHKNEKLNLWAIPLPTDEPMVYRSQRYFHDSMGLQPIQFQGFVGFRSWGKAFGTLLWAIYFITISSFGVTRNLLFKYPEILTMGVFSRKGPKREDLKKLRFTSSIIGEGWKTKSNQNQADLTKPDSKAIVKVSGPDPGYRATATMLVSCAMTLLLEKENCSEKGGVMSPGMAFYNTKIFNTLQDGGITFEYQDI